MTAVAVATDTATGIVTAVDTVTVEATETVVDAEEAEVVEAAGEDVVVVEAAAVAWNAQLRSILMRKTTQVCWSLHLWFTYTLSGQKDVNRCKAANMVSYDPLKTKYSQLENSDVRRESKSSIYTYK